MKLKAVTILLVMMCWGTSHALTRRDSIQEAITYQIEHYPSSRLCDVYKNFMQDNFGPGHLMADTVEAAKYLRSELASTKDFGGPVYEPTGFKGNFVRVNLSLIADGTVSYDSFFDAFVRSVRGIAPPAADDWIKQWREIDGIIAEMGLSFEDEDADRNKLDRQFLEGNFVVHHSKAFNESNNFHYRIMSKEIFSNDILPLIKSAHQ